MATAKKASTARKSSTSSAAKSVKQKPRSTTSGNAVKAEIVIGQDKSPEYPETSQVLRGGGVARGAILHVKIPTPAPTNATDEANTPPATDDQLAAIGRLKEGGEFTFDVVTSLPLSEGGYVSVREVRLVGKERGRAIVEVVS